MITETLQTYIETEILPQYDSFDKGHNRHHIQQVIDESLILAQSYDVDRNMVYVIAAYHDSGIPQGRELHHLFSGEKLLADTRLHEWFTPEQLLIMRDAIEDHRASGKNAPRTIYGCIVAEADRDIVASVILRRTIQFGLKQFPNEPFAFHFERAVAHLNEKYAEGGYLKLHLNSAKNERGLAELRALIADKVALEKACVAIFNEELTT